MKIYDCILLHETTHLKANEKKSNVLSTTDDEIRPKQRKDKD